MSNEKTYLRPKQIWSETGIKQKQLQNARLKKYLKDIKSDPGGRIYYFSVEEVRKVFPLAK